LVFTHGVVCCPPDNQDCSDDEKMPGHENLTEKDIELFRHIQELALQVYTLTHTDARTQTHR
jgi:hypothetical protein